MAGHVRVDEKPTTTRPLVEEEGLCFVPDGRLRCFLDFGNYLFYIVSMKSRRNQSRNYEPLGEFETLVLMAVLRLGEKAYGMKIHQELEDTAGRKCSFGALYTTLDRLEEKGYLSSRVGVPTAERGGRAKKYFEVKALGMATLRHAHAATMRMAEGIEPLLGGAS